MPWVQLIKCAELIDQQLQAFLVNNIEILIVNFNNQITAFSNFCTHANVPLSLGWINTNGHVTCAMHHAEYDPQTGEHLTGPGSLNLRKYEVRKKNSWIEVYIDKEVENGKDKKIQIIPLPHANRDFFLKNLKDTLNEYKKDEN